MAHKNITNFVAIGCFAALMTGCSIEPTIDYGEKCPPHSQSEGISYIVDENGDRHYDDSVKYKDSFDSGICPAEHELCRIDNEQKYYCMAKCTTSSHINCDGRCIDPENDKKYCGAKGMCIESSEDSMNYRGTRCKEDETCLDGRCRALNCPRGEHRYNDDCEKDTVETCGSHDNDCTASLGWVKGVCKDGACKASKCENNYNLIEGICVATPCATGKSVCIGEQRHYCQDGVNKVENCPDGCKDGECISEIGLDEKCDIATFVDSCSDNKKAIYHCSDKDKDGVYTIEAEACSEGDICVNARCVCSPTAPPVCVNSTSYKICSDGIYMTKNCADGETCYKGMCMKPGKKCTSHDECDAVNHETCVDGICRFTPQCYPGITPSACLKDNSLLRQCAEPGIYKDKACRFDETCDVESLSCKARKGQECSTGSFIPKCHLDPDATSSPHYLEVCRNGKIIFERCPGETFCGITENNVGGCWQQCSHYKQSGCFIYNDQTIDPEIAYCEYVKNYNNEKKLAMVIQKAKCDDKIEVSQFCFRDPKTGYIGRHLLNCTRHNSTCNHETGFCNDMKPCENPGAFCENNKAVMCFKNPIGDGFVMSEEHCPAEHPCDIINAELITTSVCAYTEGDASTLGICKDNLLSRHDGEYIFEYSCSKGCAKTTSENGTPYDICEEVLHPDPQVPPM